MRVLVTRPEPDGERTAAKLRARGCEVMLAPLLRVETVDADLDGAWHVVALTSVNAVRAIAGHPKLQDLARAPGLCGRRAHRRCRASRRASTTSSPRTATLGDLARVMKTHLRAGAPRALPRRRGPLRRSRGRPCRGVDRRRDGRRLSRRRGFGVPARRPRCAERRAARRGAAFLAAQRRDLCRLRRGRRDFRPGAGARALLPVAAGRASRWRPPGPAAWRWPTVRPRPR